MSSVPQAEAPGSLNLSFVLVVEVHVPPLQAVAISFSDITVLPDH
jgi:hypothetical protein